jgi:hypothetical protein
VIMDLEFEGPLALDARIDATASEVANVPATVVPLQVLPDASAVVAVIVVDVV